MNPDPKTQQNCTVIVIGRFHFNYSDPGDTWSYKSRYNVSCFYNMTSTSNISVSLPFMYGNAYLGQYFFVMQDKSIVNCKYTNLGHVWTQPVNNMSTSFKYYVSYMIEYDIAYKFFNQTMHNQTFTFVQNSNFNYTSTYDMNFITTPFESTVMPFGNAFENDSSIVGPLIISKGCVVPNKSQNYCNYRTTLEVLEFDLPIGYYGEMYGSYRQIQCNHTTSSIHMAGYFGSIMSRGIINCADKYPYNQWIYGIDPSNRTSGHYMGIYYDITLSTGYVNGYRTIVNLSISYNMENSMSTIDQFIHEILENSAGNNVTARYDFYPINQMLNLLQIGNGLNTSIIIQKALSKANRTVIYDSFNNCDADSNSTFPPIKLPKTTPDPTMTPMTPTFTTEKGESSYSSSEVNPRYTTVQFESSHTAGQVNPTFTTEIGESSYSPFEVNPIYTTEKDDSSHTAYQFNPTFTTEKGDSSYQPSEINPRYTTEKVESSYTAGQVNLTFTTEKGESNNSPSEVKPRYTTEKVESSYSPSEVNPKYTTEKVESSHTAGQFNPTFTTEEGESNYSPSEVNPRHTTEKVDLSYSPSEVNPRYTTENVESSNTAGQVNPTFTTEKVDSSYTAGQVNPTFTTEKGESNNSPSEVNPKHITEKVDSSFPTSEVNPRFTTNKVESSYSTHHFTVVSSYTTTKDYTTPSGESHTSISTSSTPGVSPCPCLNLGRCIYYTTDLYKCNCTDGFYGSFCQKSSVSCPSIDTCNPNGMCSIVNETPRCKCTAGWQGSNCTQDINECTSANNQSCGMNANCINTLGSYTCICQPGFKFIGSDCQEMAIMELNTTRIFERASYYEQSDIIYLENTFSLGDGSHTSFRISRNGYIMPGSEYCWYSSFWGDLSYSYCSFIAGYMGPFTVKNNASIRYDIVYKSKPSDNPAFRQKVDSVIHQANPGLNYSSEMILYIYWNNVQRYDWYSYFYGYNTNERANFQVIISSDGINTYAIFNHDKPTWNPNSYFYNNFVSGYADARGTYGAVPQSMNATSSDLSRFVGNTGVYGRWVYKIGSHQSAQTRCINWITRASYAQSKNGSLTCTMCPPTFHQALTVGGRLHSASTCKFIGNISESFVITLNLRTRMSFMFNDPVYSAGICSYTLTFKNSMANQMKSLCKQNISSWEQINILTNNISKIQSIFKRMQFDQISGGALNKRYPLAGPLYVIDWHIWDNYNNENYGFQTCINEARMYSAFNKVRPACGSSETYWTIRQQIALMNGDPHITTLDSRSWTFNGLGEYTLARTRFDLNQRSSEALPMILQARTAAPISKVTNETLKATVFTGFAVMANNTPTIQILNNISTMEVDVFINGSFVTNIRLLAEQYTILSFEGGYMSSSSNTSININFDADFSIQVTKTMDFLQITASMGTSFKNVLEGLLGNFNGDSTDDFIMPNGTLVSDNSTERQLFFYGQTWRVTSESESLFSYSPEATFDSFYDPNFEPIYSEDFADVSKLLHFFRNNTELLEAANLTCRNPSQSVYIACMYDTAQLQDIGAGKSLRDSNDDFVYTVTMNENMPPTFNMTDVIQVTLNQEFEITLNVFDSNGNNFSLSASETLLDENTMSSASTLEISLTGNILKVTITNALSAGFSVLAIDTFNSASIWQPAIRLCACQNGGVCSFEYLNGPMSTNSSTNVYLAQCDCPVFYSGFQCEIMPCQTVPSPCFNSSSCEMVSGSNFTCGPCPSGMVGDGRMCQDRNECAENATLCEDECINTKESYRCVCTQSGYQISSTDSSRCSDIDECTAGTHTCKNNQICNNTIGSYQCLCTPGYKMDMFGDCNDINECSYVICESNSECVNYPGSYQCRCLPGYTKQNGLCVDVNECLKISACQSNAYCLNSPGSFSCLCQEGFEQQGSSCIKIASDCSNITCVHGTCLIVNNVANCVCEKTFGGNRCDKTIRQYTVSGKLFNYLRGVPVAEEFAGIYTQISSLEYQQRGNKICVFLTNAIKMSGSPLGNLDTFIGCEFDHFSQGSVIFNANMQFNADSSTTISANTVQTAINQGSMAYYRSSNNLEYGPANSTSSISVTDVNECSSNTHDCDEKATCTNTDGSYRCQCNDLYETAPMKRSGTDCILGAGVFIIIGVCVATLVLVFVFTIFITQRIRFKRRNVNKWETVTDE